MIQLPEIKIFQQDKNNHKYAWSDHYGALHVISRYIGHEVTIKSAFDYFIWHHGCVGPWLNKHPDLVSSVVKDKTIRQFVERKDQELYLRQHGYKFVKSIGLPIIYEEMPKQLKRIKNSLLIMPTHTLLGDKKADAVYYENYINHIRKYLDEYEYVSVCLHKNCIDNNMWVEEFKSLGVSIIEGARTDDANAYLRQLYLFNQFETMTTPDWGSHVAYALYCGSKVSISGPKIERTREDYMRDGTWAKNQKILEILLHKNTQQEKITILASLFVSPAQAIANRALGQHLIGFDNKLSPKDLKHLITGTLSYKFEYNKLRLVNNLYRAYKNITSAT